MKRTYEKEEVWQWMTDHKQHMIYCNPEDQNIFFRRRMALLGLSTAATLGLG